MSQKHDATSQKRLEPSTVMTLEKVTKEDHFQEDEYHFTELATKTNNGSYKLK